MVVVAFVVAPSFPPPSETGIVPPSVAESGVGDRTKRREATDIAPALPPAARISGHGDGNDGLGPGSPAPRVKVSIFFNYAGA